MQFTVCQKHSTFALSNLTYCRYALSNLAHSTKVLSNSIFDSISSVSRMSLGLGCGSGSRCKILITLPLFALLATDCVRETMIQKHSHAYKYAHLNMYLHIQLHTYIHIYMFDQTHTCICMYMHYASIYRYYLCNIYANI